MGHKDVMEHCSRCQATLSPGAPFCASCGAVAPSEAVDVDSGVPDAEKRTPVLTKPVTATSTVTDGPTPSSDKARLEYDERGLSPAPAKPARRGWKKRVAITVVLLLLAVPLIAMLSGLRLVSGTRATAFVAADLTQKSTRWWRTSCPTQIMRTDGILTCEVTDRQTGATLGTVEVIQREDGSLAIHSYSSPVSSAFGPTTNPAATPAPSRSPRPSPEEVLAEQNAAARARVKTLKGAHPKQKFGRFQPARKPLNSPWIVSISGNRALWWVWNDSVSGWQSQSVLLRMRDLRFERIRNVDVTGDGRIDFILTGTAPSSRVPYGSLVVNRGNDAEAATFKDAQGRYGATFNLKWTGSELISDYGSWNRISAPEGYSRTRWDRKGRSSLVWVERPA